VKDQPLPKAPQLEMPRVEPIAAPAAPTAPVAADRSPDHLGRLEPELGFGGPVGPRSDGRIEPSIDFVGGPVANHGDRIEPSFDPSQLSADERLAMLPHDAAIQPINAGPVPAGAGGDVYVHNAPLAQAQAAAAPAPQRAPERGSPIEFGIR
jgi:hypothetical protein